MALETQEGVPGAFARRRPRSELGETWGNPRENGGPFAIIGPKEAPRRRGALVGLRRPPRAKGSGRSLGRSAQGSSARSPPRTRSHALEVRKASRPPVARVAELDRSGNSGRRDRRLE